MGSGGASICKRRVRSAPGVNLFLETVMKIDGKTKSEKQTFLEYRRNQEASVIGAIADKRSPISSLLSIELNTTELCNRKCVFCPRVDPDIYPNRDLHMSDDLVRKIASDLAAISFRGRISLSGFGEPLLNKRLSKHVRMLRDILADNIIDTNTNGDRLTSEVISDLMAAGISAVYVNMYDGPEQRGHFESMFAVAGVPSERYKLRPHWTGSEESFGLTLNNRSGMVTSAAADLKVPETAKTSKCFYPFSRGMVDWNGDMLLCSNDWGRKYVVGSVLEKSIGELWLSERMNAARRKLAAENREFAPCSKCDVIGTLTGEYSYNLLMKSGLV
jgi:radical SAM protein with 4Fe4S-binding SPASM domain